MPYIKAQKREGIKPFLRSAISWVISPGDLTYAITYLMHLYAMAAVEPDFSRLSEALTACECAKLEFYRTVMVPYEDGKRAVNGRVSHMDQL